MTAAMTCVSILVLSIYSSVFLHDYAEALIVSPRGLGHLNTDIPYCAAPLAQQFELSPTCARSSRRQARRLRMDDEIARKGIKEELTTRDEYLATRFTKLSESGHDLTPLTPSETQEAASHLSLSEKAVLFGGVAAEEGSSGARRVWREHREKGLYACTVGGLPLFTSGWKLEPRKQDDCPSFAEPCDEEHLLEEFDAERGVTSVCCARSRVRVGLVIDDSESPSGKRYLVTGAALEFHPLGTALPVRCQPENYWGSEGQYRAWILE